jgi:hypothetical protein
MLVETSREPTCTVLMVDGLPGRDFRTLIFFDLDELAVFAYFNFNFIAIRFPYLGFINRNRFTIFYLSFLLDFLDLAASRIFLDRFLDYCRDSCPVYFLLFPSKTRRSVCHCEG